MLTDKEEYLMNILWTRDVPMTSVELMEALPENGPVKKDTGLHRIINSLLDQDLIHISGAVLSGKLYARQFSPSCTREEYTIKAFTNKAMNKRALTEMALGLIKAAKGIEEKEDSSEPTQIDDEFVNKLENMVKAMED